MQILKEISRKEFINQFGTKEQCLSFLAKEKWLNGYRCLKCSHDQFIKGKQIHSRRCCKCNYDESPTSNTRFHKIKFGITKAFEMLYDIVTSKKGANSIWLAERHGVNQKTAWLFRQKMQEVMKSSKNYPLEGSIHVDEFEIGTPKKGEQGRSKSESKIRIILAVEERNGRAGRAYAQVISDFSSESLKTIFTDHIAKHSEIKADCWSGYKPIKNHYPNLTQHLSMNGANFRMLHRQIRNFKNWLRGVHSYCNKEYMTRYIDEYIFRFNRRNHRETILLKILERMISAKPMTFAEIQILAT